MVGLALVFAVLEGALRKWTPYFGSGIPRYAAYFSKDLIFGMLLFLPARAAPSAASATFSRWLKAGVLLFVLGAGLSCLHGYNLAGSMLTCRAVIFLPAIAYLGARRLGGPLVRQAAWLLALVTVGNFALAVGQNRLPGSHFLNKYATDMRQVVELESGVRATGTFAYISGLGVLAPVGIWAGLVLLAAARGAGWQIGAYATLAAGFGCGLASVSRAPVAIGGAMILGWVVLSRAGQRLLLRSLVACSLVIALVWGAGISRTFTRLGQDLLVRHEEARDGFEQRAFGQLTEMITAIRSAPLGWGPGTEQVGGNYAASGEMRFTNYEYQLPRMVMEAGVLGLAGFLVICGGALWALQQARRRAETDGERSVLLATQLLLLPMFYTNVAYNHTASAFAWIIFAVVLASVRSQPPAEPPRWRARKRQTSRPGSACAPATGAMNTDPPDLAQPVADVIQPA